MKDLRASENARTELEREAGELRVAKKKLEEL